MTSKLALVGRARALQEHQREKLVINKGVWAKLINAIEVRIVVPFDWEKEGGRILGGGRRGCDVLDFDQAVTWGGLLMTMY